MAKEDDHSIFQVCRNEKLSSPTDGKTIVATARFLKPCVQTVSQAVPVPNTPLLFEIFSQNRKSWPEKVEIKGWHFPQKRWEEWVVEKMAGKYGGLWNSTGIFDPIISSLYELRCNKDLLLGLVEFWCPETNTFVFPWGEATVTLEDVMIIGGFSTFGESVTKPLQGEHLVKIEEEMKNKRLIISRNYKSKKPSHGAWIKHFLEKEENDYDCDYEHVAFLSLWLSRYVFPNNIVSKQVFSIAIHLSTNTRMALAPAVLASLYKNLTSLKNQAMSCRDHQELITVSGPLQLLQIWAFERFPCLGPTIPNTLKPGEPRAARFHKLNAKISISLVRSVLRLQDNFVWRPYIADLENWRHPSYYKETKLLVFDYNDPDEELKSFARCLAACVLVGIDCKEEYLPHRVAMQFGFDQDLPAAFPVSTVLWENASFAVLPSSFRPCVSDRYLNWWNTSMSARKAALKKNITSNKNRSSSPTSSSSVRAKRKANECPPEFGEKKPKTLETKAEPQGCCSSISNETQNCVDKLDNPVCSLPVQVQVQRTKCSAKHSATISCLSPASASFVSNVKRPACEEYNSHSDAVILSERTKHFEEQRFKGNSKDSAEMYGLKSTNAYSQVVADRSHASAASDSKVKKQACDLKSSNAVPQVFADKNSVKNLASAAYVSEGKRPGYEDYSDTDRTPLSERLKHIRGRGTPKRRAGIHKVSPAARCQFRTTDSPTSKVPNGNVRRRVLYYNCPKKKSNHSASVKESKTRMGEGLLKSSKNVSTKDTTSGSSSGSGSIQKIVLELQERLTRLEKGARISTK